MTTTGLILVNLINISWPSTNETHKKICDNSITMKSQKVKRARILYWVERLMGIRISQEAAGKMRRGRLTPFIKYSGGFLLLIGVAIGWQVFSTSAAPSASITYSTDGGNSWSSTPTVKSGQEVIARAYFDNDGSSNVTDAQISTSLPAGFTRVAGSTRTCLNPGTTNPASPSSELACNDSAGQGGAITEAAVWSGSNLAVAPNAGVYGTPTNATSGLMAAGKKRYLNLHQCLRYAGVQYITVAINDPPATDWYAGTNTGNTADGAYNCGTNTGGWTLYPTISGVQNLDLLGKRYVNLHQCLRYYSDANGTRYINSLIATTGSATWAAGTNTANTANTTVSCTAGTGWTDHTTISDVQALDMLNNRYANLHQCLRVYTSGYYLSAFINDPPATAWRTGTNASNTPDAMLVCPDIAGWPTHATLSDFQVLDTLDTSRGQGFVEYKMTAPAVTSAQTFNQTATLTGTGTGNPTSNGSITVEPDLLLLYSTNNGASWTTDPRVAAGTNVRVRVFSHNKRNLTAATAQVGATLPSGFSLVPGSTRVCLNPGTLDPTNPLAEVICNNTAGQGGAISEGAVWSSSTLAISPTAGLFGQATNATSGYLAAGKDKYFNLHQCLRHSDPAFDWITDVVDDPPAGDWYAGTNASNTADSAYDCGAASWATHTTVSGVQNLDLLGKRYVNLHQCAHYYPDATNGNRWINGLINTQAAAGWATGTNTANTANSAVSCAVPGSGWTYYAPFVNVQPLDMLTNRYVNLHQCVRTQPSPTVYVSLFINNPPATGWGTGTKASNTPDATLSCPAVAGWTGHSTLSDFQVIDTLDINRGQVFVEFDMLAPTPQMQTDYVHTASLTNTGTGNQSAQDSVTVLVNPGVIITQTGDSTNVTEGGASDTIYVQLTSPPQTDVTLTFTNDNGELVAIPPVTFTPSNWSTQQPVSVIAIDDSIIEGPHTDFLNYTTSSSDTAFNGLSGDNVVTVNITDNDSPGANVIVTDDITSEDGDTGQFCITLLTQPSADVTIDLSSSDTNEVSVPPSVTILAANWNQQSANCVTTTGVDDGSVGDPIKTVTITTGNVTSADPNYNALDGSTIDNVTMYNQNNDPPGFKVTVIDGVTTEDGGTATVEFLLLSQPDGGADVTIPLSIDDPTEGTLSGVTSITITNANWNNGATNRVTITGVNDDFTDGDVTYHLVTGDPSSSDPIYNAFTGADIVDPLLTNIDTDIAGVTVTPTSGTTDVTEGGASDTVQIVLNTRPAPGNVVVITVQPQPQLDVGAGAGEAIQLTFDTNNWNVPQTVTVSAPDDDQLEGAHSALLNYLINTGTTTEHSYKSVTGIPATTVNITDNDTATASITTLDDAAENPENNGHFRVHLSKQNSTGGPITVNYSVGGTATPGSDYVPLSGNVAVPSGASSADITVDVTGMDDDLLEGTQTVIVTLTGTDNAQVTIDDANNQATVGILDDEIQTASASLAVTQNGDEAGPVDVVYQVTLTNQNETGGPISFSINPSGGSAISGIDYVDFVGQTISVPNGATSGTHTVTVIDDNLVEGPQTVRASIGSPSLIGLAISNTSAIGTITDNDTAKVTIAATDATATEGTSDGGEFTVNFSAPNSSSDMVIVYYEVSGSAVAGTDYAPLSGQVQIPADADSATIAVTTDGFDDPDFEGNESVIVTLTGTSNTSFVLGTPIAAMVVITDNDTQPSDPTPQPQPQPEPQPAPATTNQAVFPQNPPTEPEPTPAEEPAPTPETSLTDTDHDGVPDEEEDKALNNGDGNGDGIPDKDQPNVASEISLVTNRPVTLAASGDCQQIHGFDVIAKANVEDPNYTYPQGLFDFELSCAQNGQSAEVTLYLDTTNHSGWTWRKFNRFGQVYATIGNGAKIHATKVGENMVTVVTYSITDGDDLDEDHAANGIILDPVGPGIHTAGFSWSWWLLLALPAATVLWLIYRKRERVS